jgi:hypothetical protein
MTGPELAIIVLIYVASLLLGQRTIALAAPEMQELGFVIAAIAAVSAAAALYYRRQRGRAPIIVQMSVGGVLAITAMMAGMFSHLIWQTLFMPALALPIAAVATGLSPLVLFPLVRRLFDDSRPAADPVTANHVTVAAGAAVLLLATAILLPAHGRPLAVPVLQRLPGMRLAMPDWPVTERSMLFENGTLRIDDPRGWGYIALRWTSGDPIQPHEYVELLVGNQMRIADRNPVSVSGHEGATFLLKSDDGSKRAMVTIWNCRDDRRSMSLFSSFSGSDEVVTATHNRIVSTVRCHRQTDRATTGAVFPSFVAPASFERDHTSPNLLFIGPAGQNIIFEPAVGGRSPVASGEVPDDVVGAMLKQVFAIQQFDAPPTMHVVKDLFNHERRIWSASGVTSGGAEIQVEVMVWYCDVREMTFIGGYATTGSHPLQHAVDILLPAACHGSK